MNIRIILSCLIISCFTFTYSLTAQETDENYFLGGSISLTSQENGYPSTLLSSITTLPGLYSSNTNDAKYFQFSSAPYIGKKINEHWDIGLVLNYAYTNYEGKEIFVSIPPIEQVFERNSSQYGLGIFSRYNFNPANKVQVFLQPGFNFFFLDEKEYRNTILSQEKNINYISISTSIGLQYNLSDKFKAIVNFGGIQFNTGSWQMAGSDSKNKFSSFVSNLRLSNIGLGFEYKL